MLQLDAKNVEMLPVELIRVLNPRERNQRGFESIVESIRNVGLKKPIVVTRRAIAGGSMSMPWFAGKAV